MHLSAFVGLDAFPVDGRMLLGKRTCSEESRHVEEVGVRVCGCGLTWCSWRGAYGLYRRYKA